MQWVGPTLGGRICWLLQCYAGYFDPAGNRDRYGPRTRHTGVLKSLGTILGAWRRRSHETGQLSVQFKVSQGILNQIFTIRSLWMRGRPVWWLLLCLGWWQDSCSVQLNERCRLIFSLGSRFSWWVNLCYSQNKASWVIKWLLLSGICEWGADCSGDSCSSWADDKTFPALPSWRQKGVATRQSSFSGTDFPDGHLCYLVLWGICDWGVD